jgi:hypothetical protein
MLPAYALGADDTMPKVTISQTIASGLSKATSLEVDTLNKEEQKADLSITRASYYESRSLEDPEIPLVSRQSGESWSLSNSLLSVVGLMETLIAIGFFLYRNRQKSLNLLSLDFMLKVFALFFVVIIIVGTSITSDFTRALVVFDEMSLLIIMIFGIQQVLLFGIRKEKAPDPIDKKRDKHFRAKRRYES